MAVKSSFVNMVLCLGVITLVCSALLAGIYVLTEEPIAKAAQAKTESAIAAVTPAFAELRNETTSDGTAYCIAVGEDSSEVAYVVNASSVGFGGRIDLMVGFLPDGTIYDTAVLGHSETPGLGAKCTEEAFAGQFKGFDPSQRKLYVRKDEGDVDAITASTITSRGYCAALRNAVEVFETIRDERFVTVLETADSVILDVTDAVETIMEENSNE